MNKNSDKKNAANKYQKIFCQKKRKTFLNLILFTAKKE